MTSGEFAALITAIGASLAGILGAIAALVAARNNAARVDALQIENKKLLSRIEELESENKKLRTANDDKTEHNEKQDRVILDQQIKINKWQEWGDRVGRQLNEMWLVVGAYEQSRGHKRKWHDTKPIGIPDPDQPGEDG